MASSRKTSMTRTLFSKSQYALFFCFFLLGFVWGKYYYYSDKQPLEVFFKDKKIRMLVQDSQIPDDIIESYHLQHQTHVEVESYQTANEISRKLAESQFDLVVVPSDVVESLIQIGRLKKLNTTLITNKNLISPDFSNLPYDKSGLYTAAVFWGIHASDNKLWTQSLAIPQNAVNLKEAHHFINYMLQKDIAFELVKFKKVATTNRELDESNIESNLKSSFIRQISLKTLNY